MGPSYDVSFAFPKNAPSPYSDRGVHSRSHVAVVASGTGSQPVPRSAFVVSHHPGGLLLLDPLRICVGVPVLGFVTFHAALRRTPRHVVLPFEALIPARSGPGRMAHHPSAGLTSPNESPRWFTVSLAPSSLCSAFPRLSWTSRPYSTRRAATRSMLPWIRARCSLGFVRISLAGLSRAHLCDPFEALRSQTNSRWSSYNRSD